MLSLSADAITHRMLKKSAREALSVADNTVDTRVKKELAKFADTGKKIIFKNVDNAIAAHVDDVTKRLYRGDLRTPNEIFSSGFKSKGTNTNIVEYVELNEPSIFIGTSKSPQEAFSKVVDAQSEGYVYIVGKKGNTTDVNNWYNSIEGYANPYAKELEVVFENIIPSSNIQGAFKIDSSGNIIGDLIVNPNFVP